MSPAPPCRCRSDHDDQLCPQRGYSCGEGFQNLDATNLAQRWLMYASPNYGLQLRGWNEAEIASFKWFYSAEAGGAAYAPPSTSPSDTWPTPRSPLPRPRPTARW